MKGCKCADCKHVKRLIDNHGYICSICLCKESEHYLTGVSVDTGECQFGELDMEESWYTE